jgi:PAT family beta-lactamase induction signal transducer AmpG
MTGHSEQADGGGGPVGHSWREAALSFFHPPVVIMLFLGFSAGLPILLIFSSLSLWLREAGIERSAVTFFSWAALGYSFKFVWAPLIDRLPLPVLTRLLGRRRSWLILSQLCVAMAIAAMACIDPALGASRVTLMALAAVALGFCSATQDIVIDAYRIESAEHEYQALMASTYMAGYRVAMITAGAGALFLADRFGSADGVYVYQAWRWTYLTMAAAMTVGMVTTLVMPEPMAQKTKNSLRHSEDYLRFVLLFVFAVTGCVLAFFFSGGPAQALKTSLTGSWVNGHVIAILVEGLRLSAGIAAAAAIAWLCLALGLVSREIVRETYIDPIVNFFERYGRGLAILILSLVGLYRISDIVLGVISNVFYQDLGFTKTEIAAVSKTFGLVMTLLGGFVGGILAVRFGVIRILFLGALLSAATNLLYMVLAGAGHDLTLLYLVISADSLAGGMASAAFVAFLSSLTDIRFTAMQYALFSSLMTLIPKITGGYAGTMVDSMGYETFFLITALIGVPVLVLVTLAGKYLALKNS